MKKKSFKIFNLSDVVVLCYLREGIQSVAYSHGNSLTVVTKLIKQVYRRLNMSNKKLGLVRLYEKVKFFFFNELIVTGLRSDQILK